MNSLCNAPQVKEQILLIPILEYLMFLTDGAPIWCLILLYEEPLGVNILGHIVIEQIKGCTNSGFVLT